MAITPRYRTQRNPETGKRETVFAKKRDGSIRLDKEGNPIREVTSWKVEVWGLDDAGKQRRKVIGSFTYKDDAKKAERDAQRDIDNGVFEWEPVEPEPEEVVPTVKAACETWIKLRALEISQNTISSYEGVLKNHIGPVFGEELVTAVTHDLVQDWVLEMQEAGKHAQTISRSLIVLSGALDRQVRSGVLQANPALGVKKPSVNKGKSDLPQWSNEEVTKFFTEAATHDLAPLFWLGELEGLRRAEILGLRWSDLRGLDSGGSVVASISQTVVADQRNGGRPLIQPKAKTRSSERAVLLSSDTVEVIKKHRDSQRFIRKQAGEVWEANDLIVCDAIGRPLRPDSVGKEVRRFLEGIGLEGTTLHGLRHHSATRLLRQGVSPALVASRLGHADVSVTYAKYGHLVTDDQASALEAIERELKAGNG